MEVGCAGGACQRDANRPLLNRGVSAGNAVASGGAVSTLDRDIATNCTDSKSSIGIRTIAGSWGEGKVCSSSDHRKTTASSMYVETGDDRREK